MTKNRIANLILAAGFSLGLAAPALAQSDNQPNSNDVSHQFQNGANRVGQGATQIGEGIRNGAILSWEAVKDGFQTAAAKISKQ